MKEKILQKATDLFLSYGFKSVTMDEIASALSMSKKTLYKFFHNKVDLVTEVTDSLYVFFSDKMKEVQQQDLNVVEENFVIKMMFRELLKTATSSPIYQLKKYYPEVHTKVKKRQNKMMRSLFLKNLDKGVQTGFYRADINKDFVFEFHITIVHYIHETYSEKEVTERYEVELLERHIRSIATEKGVKELEVQLQKIKNNEE